MGEDRTDEGTVSAAIDLGELTQPGEAPEGAPPPPGWARHVPKVVVAALAALLVLGGSAIGRSPALAEPLWTRPIYWDSFAFDSGRVFVPNRDGNTLVALDAETGAELWRREGGQGRLYAINAGADAVVLQYNDGGFVADVATGAVLYRLSGFAYVWGLTSDGRLILIEYGEPGSADCPDSDVGCEVLQAISAGGGPTAWRVVIRQALIAQWEPSASGTDRFATITDQGHVDVFDATTGAIAETMRIAPAVTSAILIDGHLIVVSRAYDLPRLLSYALGSGQPEWQIELTETADRFLHVYHCGAYACVFSGNSTLVVDPRTGDDALQLADAAPIPMGELFLVVDAPTGDAEPNPELTLWDPATGAMVADVPDGTPVPWNDDAGRGLLARAGNAGTEFILVDPSGTSRSLGTVPIHDAVCTAQGDLLLCRSLGKAYVWRLPV